MKLFIDCEFNSMGGQLLSMALVPEDLNEPPFYEELNISEALNEWVRANVVLRKNPLTASEFKRVLEGFLNRFDSVHIMADWPEDIKYFCEALITGPGTRIHYPPLTMEVRADLEAESVFPHYALADAQAIRDGYVARQEADADNDLDNHLIQGTVVDRQ